MKVYVLEVVQSSVHAIDLDHITGGSKARIITPMRRASMYNLAGRLGQALGRPGGVPALFGDACGLYEASRW